MKSLFGMISGSVGTSIFNFLTLTISASRIDLVELDQYFISRDSAESLLKFLFVAQIGSICVALIQARGGSLAPLRQAFLLGAVLVACAMAIWSLAFTNFAEFFMPGGSGVIQGDLATLSVWIAVFCVLVWLDNLVSPYLIHVKRFFVYHFSNSIGAVLTCAYVYFSPELTPIILAQAFAIGKFLTVLPKVFFALSMGGSQEKARHKSVLSMVLNYIPANILQPLNRNLMLAGVVFLNPGNFAIYSIFTRYYSSAQNIVTLNIFNLSAKQLSESSDDKGAIIQVLTRHFKSTLPLLFLVSVAFVVAQETRVGNHLPPFLSSPISAEIALIVLITFLPDGLSFILSRRSMIRGEVKWDSRISFMQVTTNILVLYPSMMLFGVLGLAYANLIVCILFSVIRSIPLLAEGATLRALLLELGICASILMTVCLVSTSNPALSTPLIVGIALATLFVVKCTIRLIAIFRSE